VLDFQKYEELVDAFENLMIENQEFSEIKLGPDKWTLKEIVWHLIDSASNNHQRFIRLQIDRKIALPGYEAEEWVSISNIQDLETISFRLEECATMIYINVTEHQMGN